MPSKPGIKLPGKLLQELALPDASRRSSHTLSTSRKAQRKAARIEKRRKPAQTDRQIRRQLSQTSKTVPNYEKDTTTETRLSTLPVKRSKRDASQNGDVVAATRTQSSNSDVTVDALALKQPEIPRRLREKLAEDDAQIAALERRLGIKGNKGLPKSFDQDGLGELLGDLEDPGFHESQRRKSVPKEERNWLQTKRRKALARDQLNSSQTVDYSKVSEDSEDSESYEDIDISSDDSDSKLDSVSFEGFDDLTGSSDDESNLEDLLDSEDFGGEKLPQRENPYVAPQPSITAKYLPPSLRKIQSGNSEGHERLRRQIQGTLNRLSEAKVLAITADMEKMYRENSRQEVSSILLNTLFVLICDPAPLSDTFMILHAGFVAAVYKTIGTEFGAQVIQRFVTQYDELSRADASSVGRRLANMVTFLAELYNFQVVGSPIIYDMIRDLTANLSEENSELLLRIAKNSGSQLRQDDSASLKDTAALLHAAVEKHGAENLSVRTKFMIETIENLTNNKVKTGLAASTVRSEHTTAMKKILGSMNRTSIKAREPLRIGLQDIRNADKRGKWWLIGASFHDDKESKPATQKNSGQNSKQVTMQNGDIDLNELAREQGMNTEIRRAIFISIVSASDDQEACMRLKRLGMKSKQRFEIPKVVVHCIGAEKQYYNRFYTKIAKQLCAERDIRKAFQFTLWEIFGRLEDKEDDDEERPQGDLDMTAIVFIAKMYGELVADGLQSLLLLKHMELAHPDAKSKTFAEVFLITLFQQLGAKPEGIERRIREVFDVLMQEPETIANLRLFLKRTVRSTRLLQDTKDKDLVRACCKAAEVSLFALVSEA